MQKSAVLLARCIAFVETYDLSPEGRVFFPEVVTELVARYNFQKFPKEYGEYDENKGIEFLEGKRGNDVIWRLTIYNTGILLDTRVNTKLSQEIIEEALIWGQAVCTTHSPMGIIRPVSSASGMKSSGGIKPSLGCRQRNNVSMPRIRPVCMSTSGW